MVALVSRISSTGIYATNATTSVGIFDEFTGSPVVDGNLKIWFDGAQLASYPGTGITLTDLSGASNNGTLGDGGRTGGTGTPIFNQITLGFTGNGNSQIAVANASSINSATTFSFNMWVSFAGFNSGNEFNNIISIREHFNIDGYRFGVKTAGNVTFWTTQTGGNLNIVSNTAVTVNKIYNISVTYDGTVCNLYQNGLLVGTQVGTYNAISSTIMWIGGNNEGLIGANMTQYAFQWYNRALTAAEIANNYNALAGRYGLTPLTSGMITKRVTSTGTIYVNGILDETTIAGSTTAMSEYPNGNVAVSGYFDEVTGGLVTNGLIAYIDASKQESYVRAGTKIIDLVNLANPATINGAVSWVANGVNNSSSYWWWPSAASANYINGTLLQNYLDMTIVFQPDNTLSTASGLSGLIGSSTDATNSDKSLRFVNVNGAGPWKTKNPDNTDGWASTATTYYINGVATTTDGASLSTGWNIFGGYRTNQATGSFAAPFNYFLGLEGYSGDARQFRGNIAAVVFYNRQLSAGEQINNYNYFAGRFGLPYIGG